MKVFWALIVVLVASTGVLLAMRGGSGVSNTTASTVSTSTTAADPTDTPISEAAATTPDDGSGVGIEEDSGDTDEPADQATPESEPAPGDDDEAVSDSPDPATPTADTSIADTPTTDLVDTSNPAPEEPAETPPPPADAPAEAVATGDGERSGDALMLNDRYRVTGEGTAESPYVVSFDALIAVEHEYAPREEGKTEIPEWIRTLDGKHVSITGFVAFPFLAATADECMVMLNQWDGCCIGVPPTPYDAVEVQFAEPLDLNRGIPNYGTITGVFRTDPFLTNGWLIGLYVMDEARLVNSGSRNQGGF